MATKATKTTETDQRISREITARGARGTLRVTVEPRPGAIVPSITLGSIPNGTFFMGAIGDTPFSGPYLKIGSISAETWVVARLSTMGGGVWVSSRAEDAKAVVEGYQVLDVAEVVLRTR